MSKTGERIKKAREAAGYSQEELADLLQVSQQAVHMWENNIISRPKKIVEMAKLFNVTVDYLLKGHAEEIALAANCALLSWEDAKDWPDNCEALESNNKIIYPMNNFILQKNFYMLRLEDDSMVNRMEGYGFYKNTYIIINPDKEPHNNDFVVAAIEGKPRLIFRQYIDDGVNKILTPLDIFKYPRIDFTSNIKIRGVVIASVGVLI